MGSALRLASSGVSDSSGNLTINFAGPSPGDVWTGSVFVSGAPASALFSITIGSTAGGLPWGTMVGGQALLVQAMAGEVVQVTSSTVVASTTYTAVFAGSIDSDQDASWTGPFPAAPNSNRTSLLVVSGGVLPYCLPSLATPPTVTSGGSPWTYGTWVSIGTTEATDGLGSAITGILPAGPSVAAYFNIELSYGTSGGATLLGTWLCAVTANAAAIEPAVLSLVPAASNIWGRVASSSASNSVMVGLNLFQVTGQVSFA